MKHVFQTTDIILNPIDKKKLTAVVLLDMSKAFDSVNHKTPSLKLPVSSGEPQGSILGPLLFGINTSLSTAKPLVKGHNYLFYIETSTSDYRHNKDAKHLIKNQVLPL